MGRFDALTQLDNKPQQEVPPVVSQKTAKPLNDKAASPQADKAAKPLVSETVKPLNRSFIPLIEKPDRYTTRLLPSVVKQIKLYAAEHDMDDKDVVTEALVEYFTNRK
jgi:hypothetical protein